MKNKYKYEIVSQDKSDALQTVIRMSGITNEFSLQDVYSHKATLESQIKESTAKIEVNRASQKNIENNHPKVAEFIKLIKKDKRNYKGIFATLLMWINFDVDSDVNERMIAERQDIVDEYDKKLKTIHKQFKIAKPVKIGYAKANK